MLHAWLVISAENAQLKPQIQVVNPMEACCSSLNHAPDNENRNEMMLHLYSYLAELSNVIHTCLARQRAVQDCPPEVRHVSIYMTSVSFCAATCWRRSVLHFPLRNPVLWQLAINSQMRLVCQQGNAWYSHHMSNKNGRSGVQASAGSCLS